ncbi:hypothetical protein DFH06DRAFT_712509 [Mycena polygramma]|nr:hypothetical protein DFH06DRAFT_712509 [Mycena polygramma]
MTPISMHSVVREQKKRTTGMSTAQIEQFLGESAAKIASLESQTAALESQIAALETQLATLAELRDREHATVAALRHLITPVRKLPVELLVEILILSVDPTNSWNTESALRVAHVCSYWRRVALTAPRVWTGKITIYLGRCTRGAAYADGLEEWLARSAPLSFPVSLDMYGDLDALNPSVVDTVLNSSPRWRYLQLSSDLPPLIARIAECKFDSLEEIDISQSCSLPLSFSAPHLRKATVPADPLELVPMPWAKLTDIFLNGFHDEGPNTSSLDILGQFPNLVTATVGANGWSVLPLARRDIVILSHLRNLSLITRIDRHGEERYLMPFFASLSAPALKDLTLDVMVRSPWVQAQFTAFQKRSPHITHLSLVSVAALTWDDLKATLFHAPSLTHLALRELEPAVNNALLSALQRTDIAAPVAPLLHDLKLHGIWGEPDLTAAIAARWWTDAELASRAVSPAVARWTRIIVSTPNAKLSQPFRKMMEVRRGEGLYVADRWGN